VLGDTNSCLSVIAAKKNHIPIFHIEAGNRCFDQRVPEETNRKIVDHISDINLTYSALARDHLLLEGFPSDRIINIGSPMFEILNSNRMNIDNSKILDKLSIVKNQYFVFSIHREENINVDNFLKLVDVINSIALTYRFPIIFSTHPRTRKFIQENNIEFNPLVKVLKPLGFFDYIKLQIESYAVLSDSGTISEESSILKFKALNLRETHERHEAYEEAAVMMVGLNKERILQALKVLESQSSNTIMDVIDYMVPNVSDKVLRIILGYTDYINRVVWQKK
jgi:UDP-N-acetylglucosamine 2-epimerase (non-hydrolysing)